MVNWQPPEVTDHKSEVMTWSVVINKNYDFQLQSRSFLNFAINNNNCATILGLHQNFYHKGQLCLLSGELSYAYAGYLSYYYLLGRVFPH